MKNADRTKKQLLTELEKLHLTIAELGKSERKRKKAEENLKQFERIVNSSLSHMSFIDINYIYQVVNNSYLQAHKKKREEIIGHSIAEILGRKVFKDVIKKNIDTCFAGKSVRYETWFDFVGSGKKYMDVSYYPYFDENNKVSGVIVDSRDITERKQMEEALRENEAQKQAILDGISSNIAFVNEKLEILWVNKVAADSVGQSRTEMLGQTCYSLWADPEKPCAGCPALKTFQTKKSEHKIMHTPDGRVWDESGEPVFDFTGKLIGVIEIAHDITERTNAEKLLRKSEKKYRDLFEKSKDAILIIHNGKFIDCNQAAINMLRYNNKNEFLNTHPSELSPERQPDGKMSFTKANEMMKIAYENGSHRFEWDHKKFDGEVFSVEVLLTAISTDEKNQILHTVWRDITERKQAEEALKESEEKYRLIVENAHDGIEITQNNQIIFTNARFAEMLGYTINELSNIFFSRIFTKQATRDLYERRSKRQAGKPVFHQYETTFIKKNGAVINVDVKYEIIDYRGTPATFAIIRDITESKKIEQEIKKKSLQLENQFEKSEKQRISTLVILNDLNKTTKDLKSALEKAKESDRLKSAFLANMSHEIRTPMNGILGFVQLLKTRKLSGEDQNKYIGIIEKSGDRLLNIINDLISISKLESGQMDISISETNINKQIEYIYTFFKPEVEKKGMQISFKNSLPDNKAFINTDSEKIYAVLTNLIKNAIKYSNKGFIKFGYVKEENNLEFFVKDTGIGIPSDIQQVIFERFIQADLTLSSPYQGAGLGLSITKAYVEMLGGKIWVESQEGGGAQFYFTIPYNHKTEINVSKSKVPKIKQEHPYKIFKIMIVEDEKATDVYLSIVVKDISKDILHAKTGAEALELFRDNQNIDLVLMDIKMPDMDGYEVTRKIREFNKDVIIIAQTAYALGGDREKAIQSGCNDHITKPIEKNDLMKVIKKHLKF